MCSQMFSANPLLLISKPQWRIPRHPCYSNLVRGPIVVAHRLLRTGREEEKTSWTWTRGKKKKNTRTGKGKM